MKAQLTVAEAALIVGRSTRAVYRWIDDQKLTTSIGERGETLVSAQEVQRVESEQRRGRPRIAQ